MQQLLTKSPLVFKIQSKKTSTLDDFSELRHLKTQFRNLKTQGKVDVFSMFFQSLLD